MESVPADQRSATIGGLVALAVAIGYLLALNIPSAQRIAPMFVLGSLLFLAIGLAVLFEAGPRRLTLDPATKTYEMIRGLPFAGRTYRGSYNDIHGIRRDSYAYGTRKDRRPIYYIMLDWDWHVARSPFRMFWSMDEFAIDQKMREIAERTKIPVVETWQ